MDAPILILLLREKMFERGFWRSLFGEAPPPPVFELSESLGVPPLSSLPFFKRFQTIRTHGKRQSSEKEEDNEREVPSETNASPSPPPLCSPQV